MPARNWPRLAWPAALIFLADQASKFFFETTGFAGDLVPGYIGLRPLYNPGFFFGFWQISRLRLFTVVVSCLVVFLTVSVRKHFPAGGRAAKHLDLSIGLIWGGVLGNLADRLLLGQVFDFIHLWPIPVFNLADMALTFGGALFALGFITAERDRAGGRGPGSPGEHTPGQRGGL